MAAAFPVANKDDGLSERTKQIFTVHAAAIFIFPVRKIKFSSWEDILWHKKSLRLKAIGETVALPDRLLSSLLAVAKIRRIFETAKYF